MSSIKTLKDILIDIKIPYTNNDEILFIKIINEKWLINDKIIKVIEDYIKSLVKFDDNRFNICRQCNIRENKFFCHKCYINICNECYKNCKSKNHNLIELKAFYVEEIKENKLYINQFISKYFILLKEKESSDGIEKANKNYEIMNDLEMNNQIEEKPMEYTNDIILIEAILEKNYINYFHYINIKECFYYLRKKYDDKIDYIIINYKIEKNTRKIKIFGYKFVINYEDTCYIIYENKKYELMEFFELKNYGNKEVLKIKLIGISKIIDASYMFEGCISLISIYNICKWNTNNVINTSSMFRDCKSLISVVDISNWNIDNNKNMSYMFSGCESLISLPDISKWNTNNVIDMSHMFSGCKSLYSLPDIYKWNFNNVIDMSYMFSWCISLKPLPDTSKWNTNNVTNMSYMFSSCESLTSEVNISQRIIYKVLNLKVYKPISNAIENIMDSMFPDYKPSISKLKNFCRIMRMKKKRIICLKGMKLLLLIHNLKMLKYMKKTRMEKLTNLKRKMKMKMKLCLNTNNIWINIILFLNNNKKILLLIPYINE